MQADLVCINCKHYNGNLTCKAFPNGIHEIIISGKDDHSQPLPEQDNNIVFEPIERDGLPLRKVG